MPEHPAPAVRTSAVDSLTRPSLMLTRFALCSCHATALTGLQQLHPGQPQRHSGVPVLHGRAQDVQGGQLLSLDELTQIFGGAGPISRPCQSLAVPALWLRLRDVPTHNGCAATNVSEPRRVCWQWPAPAARLCGSLARACERASERRCPHVNLQRPLSPQPARRAPVLKCATSPSSSSPRCSSSAEQASLDAVAEGTSIVAFHTIPADRTFPMFSLDLSGRVEF